MRAARDCGIQKEMVSMATTKKEEVGSEIQILPVARGAISFCVLGTTPLICNRMSQKVWFELLAPKGKKTSVEKASSMKHDPIREFRDSPYLINDAKAPTLIGMMPTAFKKSMGVAALDTPGAKKAQIGRLVYIEGELLPIYGIPKLFMSITRSADINHTPDVRTRAILPEWACFLTIHFQKPILREQSIGNLLAAAGLQSGVGDWRQEKGSGSYGCFRLASHDDKDFVRITKTMGRVPQQKALDHPVAYNDETAEMLAWFEKEVVDRGFKKDSAGHLVANARPVGAKIRDVGDPAKRAKSKPNGDAKGAVQ